MFVNVVNPFEIEELPCDLITSSDLVLTHAHGRYYVRYLSIGKAKLPYVYQLKKFVAMVLIDTSI